MPNIGKQFPLDAISDDFLDLLPFAVSWAEIPGGRIRYANRIFVETFGYAADHFGTADEFMDASYIREKHRTTCREYWKYFTVSDDDGMTGIPETEVDILCADGSIRTVVHSGIIVPAHGVGVAFFKDISSLKRERRILKRFAYVDALTGLANRQALLDRWREESRQEGRLALLMIDLDGFKPINDVHGHAAGDEVLKIVAQRIKRAIRKRDLACRLGGDEFLILMSAPGDCQMMEMICERLVAAIAQPMTVDGVTISVSASIGGCVYPDQAEDIHQLFQRTDRAMYYAKRAGKSGWSWWTPDLGTSPRQMPPLPNET